MCFTTYNYNRKLSRINSCAFKDISKENSINLIQHLSFLENNDYIILYTDECLIYKSILKDKGFVSKNSKLVKRCICKGFKHVTLFYIFTSKGDHYYKLSDINSTSFRFWKFIKESL